jgi:PTS system ascorbate-specific IIA component
MLRAIGARVPTPCRAATLEFIMIGVLIVAHDTLAESLARGVSHVLGSRPAQFESFPVSANDDPLLLLPQARAAIERLDTGDGVLVFSDLYGATPCNLAVKLRVAGRVEAIAGVNLPMLVRTFTYRSKSMDVLIKKAVSGGCEGVVHVAAEPVYASARG